jgi:hypothetical protein
MKNQSNYKKSNGDQPATRNFGAGVISHNLTGPVKFSAWSMDVMIEGANAPRFMDLTTHNHANSGNGALTSSIAGLDVADPASELDCKKLSDANVAARDDMKSGAHGDSVQQVGEGNTTITHGVYTNANGVSGVVRASSRAIISQYDNTFNHGMTSADKVANTNANGKVESQACGDHVYRRAYFMPHTSHTEARIIEDIFKAAPNGGGSLLLSIDWPGGPKKGLSTKSPCEDCNALLCEASKCMDIKLCNEDNEPKKPDCEED